MTEGQVAETVEEETLRLNALSPRRKRWSRLMKWRVTKVRIQDGDDWLDLPAADGSRFPRLQKKATVRRRIKLISMANPSLKLRVGRLAEEEKKA